MKRQCGEWQAGLKPALEMQILTLHVSTLTAYWNDDDDGI